MRPRALLTPFGRRARASAGAPPRLAGAPLPPPRPFPRALWSRVPSGAPPPLARLPFRGALLWSRCWRSLASCAPCGGAGLLPLSPVPSPCVPVPSASRSRPVRLPTSYLSASAIGTANPPHSLRFRPHKRSACRSANLLTRYVCALPPLYPFFKWRSVATENMRK